MAQMYLEENWIITRRLLDVDFQNIQQNHAGDWKKVMFASAGRWGGGLERKAIGRQRS